MPLEHQVAPPALPPKGLDQALEPQLQHAAPPSVARAPPQRHSNSRKSSADLLLGPRAVASAAPSVARAPPQRHSQTSPADVPLCPPAATKNPPARGRRADSGDSDGAGNTFKYGKPVAQPAQQPNAIDPSSGKAVYCDPLYAGATGVKGAQGTQANYRPIVELKRKGRAENKFGGAGGRSDAPVATAAPPAPSSQEDVTEKKKKKKMNMFGRKEERIKSPPTPKSTHLQERRPDRTKAPGQMKTSSGWRNKRDKTSKQSKPPGSASTATTTHAVGHDYRSAANAAREKSATHSVEHDYRSAADVTANAVTAALEQSEYKPVLDLLAQAVQKGDRPCPVCKELVWSNQDRFTEDHVTYVHHACEVSQRYSVITAAYYGCSTVVLVGVTGLAMPLGCHSRKGPSPYGRLKGSARACLTAPIPANWQMALSPVWIRGELNSRSPH